ncbi:synaptic vesicle glycoprotein 2B-like [Homalodisca vitripennis]|uniref:synaptic vesicle glycoprotein 2B-like n=1 Tax=Homalodisca vitripennis TaxID=197043 RepID=UPI001EEA3AA4|nr:synaptic vesicle glycoprotein 2B-like [Homalodisca vitripennis]
MGRKYVLVRGMSLNVLMYVLGAFAPNFWTFCVLKVISGALSCPAMIATFPFLGELTPSKRRSQAFLMTSSMKTLCILYCGLIGWLTLQGTWRIDLGFVIFTPWRLFYLLCGIPSLLCAIMFYVAPESPKFLLSKGRQDESMRVLRKIYSVNYGKPQENFTVQSISAEENENRNVASTTRNKGAAGTLKHVFDQTVPLFKPPYFKSLILCLFIITTICICFNSIFVWLPELTNRMALYKEQNEGRFYACEMLMRDSILPTITNTSSLSECKVNLTTAVFVPNIIISVVLPVVTLIASVVVPLFDRRIVLAALFVICGCMGLSINWVPNATFVVMMIGGINAFTFVAYNVLTTITIELFPTYIRATAVSLNMVACRFGSILGSQLFSLLLDSLCTLLFNLITGLLFCCAVVPIFFDLKKQPKQGDLPGNKATEVEGQS